MTRVSFTCSAVLILCGSLLVLAQDPAVSPQPADIDGAVSRVYKFVNGSDLRLHIFNPQKRGADRTTPAIVFFFGGGWTTGSITQFTPQAKHVADRGLIAIVADYRVFNRHHTGAFEAIADAKSAIRWVRAHAGELGIDPGRIAAGGGSAGAHIALGAAIFDRFDEANEDTRVSSKPDALVLFNPPVDTTPEASPQPSGNAREMFSARFGDRAREGSPIHHLRSGLPPTLILHGKEDVVVPYAYVERFCAEARRHGNRCELVGYEGAGHGFFNPGRGEGKWYRETLLAAERFLTDLGYLPRVTQPESARP